MKPEPPWLKLTKVLSREVIGESSRKKKKNRMCMSHSPAQNCENMNTQQAFPPNWHAGDCTVPHHSRVCCGRSSCSK